jgi:hypothetical protein
MTDIPSALANVAATLDRLGWPTCAASVREAITEHERLTRELTEASIQADTDHRMMLMEREIAATEVRDRGTAERERDEAQRRANRYAGQIGEMTGELTAARAPAPPPAGVGSALIAELRAQHDSCIHPHGTIEAPDEMDDCDMCNLRDVLRRAAATIERQSAQLAALTRRAEDDERDREAAAEQISNLMRDQAEASGESERLFSQLRAEAQAKYAALIQRAETAERERDALRAVPLRFPRDDAGKITGGCISAVSTLMAYQSLRYATHEQIEGVLLAAESVHGTALSQALSGQPEPLMPSLPWRPIEEAPTDGTVLILAKFGWTIDTAGVEMGSEEWRRRMFEVKPSVYSLWWVSRGLWERDRWTDGTEPCGIADPTHFMEVRLPPQLSAAPIDTGTEDKS